MKSTIFDKAKKTRKNVKFDTLIKVITFFSNTRSEKWKDIVKDWRVIGMADTIGDNEHYELPIGWNITFDPTDEATFPQELMYLSNIFNKAKLNQRGWICCCSHNELHELFLIEHMITKSRLVVGNICIKHFKNRRMDVSVSSLKRQKSRFKQNGRLTKIDTIFRPS
jgi:hypothetical protein